MELKRIKKGVSFLSGPTNLGIIEADEGAVLIDSGIDDDTARRALNLGVDIRAVINTHSHADHCGGNALIKRRTGALVFAPEIESCFIETPLLQPSFLCSAYPVEETRNKFFMAKPSVVDSAFRGGSITVLGREIKAVALPGHSVNHFGIEVDGILFCGDAFLSADVLRKHPLPLYFDAGKEKETLKKMLGLDEEFYVPSHGEPSADISDTISANLEKMSSIEEVILHRPGLSTDEILADLVDLERVSDYFLCRASLMSFLTYLQESGKIRCAIEGKRLIWTEA